MDLLTIYTNTGKVEFGIDKVKYIITSDFSQVFKIIQTLNKVFSKALDSEYDEENMQMRVLINNKNVDKNNLLFNVNHLFDLETDLKLGAKSLTLNYLTTVLRDIECHELVSTINTLMHSVNDYLGELISDKHLKVMLNELNLKLIQKNLSARLVRDELEYHSYNLSYDELILYQLDKLNIIAQKNGLLTYWVVLNIPEMTAQIEKVIMGLEKNIRVIVHTNNSIVRDLKDALVINKRVLDLSDETEIYNVVMMNYSKHLTIEELKQKLIEYVNLKDRSTHEIDGLI